MKYDEYLRRVPKVELHCHFEGTVRPQTFADLAKKHGVELPTEDAERLYDYDSIYEFLKIFAMVSSASLTDSLAPEASLSTGVASAYFCPSPAGKASCDNGDFLK